MTRPLEAQTLRARSIDDLIDLIPSLLGFHPAESLVVVCIVNGHVAVTARVDLDAVSTPDEADACFAPLWDRFPGADCVVVVFSRRAEVAWLALEAAPWWVPEQARLDLAHVDGCRIYAFNGHVGRPYDPTGSALAAEAAYRGIRVLPAREALAACLEPVLPRAELTAAVEWAIAEPPRQLLTRAHSVVAEAMNSEVVLDAETAASLALAAYNLGFVECVLGGLTQESAESSVRLWTGVVRSTLQEVGEAAAIVLGLAAWLNGDGALLNVCLERASGLAVDSPWYRFLQIVVGIALPPQRWEGVRSELIGGSTDAWPDSAWDLCGEPWSGPSGDD